MQHGHSYPKYSDLRSTEAAWRRDFSQVAVEIQYALQACAPVDPEIERPDYSTADGVFDFIDAMWAALFDKAAETLPDLRARAAIGKLGDLITMPHDAVFAIVSPHLDDLRRCLPPKYHP
ncbi:hypothetical protein H9P43_002260 [Blastocladiella emersonii ATCC 22665]|nr:hypothetical protein H9P43_002260 [Blastocladiella emersonii ATCC 22665]